MKSVCHHRKWISVLLGIFLLVLFIVKLMQPIVAEVGTLDTEVGAVTPRMEHIYLELDKACYTTEEIKLGQVTLTVRNDGALGIEYWPPVAVLQIQQEGAWHNLKNLFGTSRVSLAPIETTGPGECEAIDFGLGKYGETLKPGHYRALLFFSEGREQEKCIGVEFDVVK